MLRRENKRSCGALAIIAVALALVCTTLLGATPAFAQSQDDDVFRVNYFTRGAGAGSGGTIRVTNPGSPPRGFAEVPPDPLPVCASFYIYRPDEQLTECCSCWLSHNALREFDVVTMTNNPLTPDPITRGTIKLVASLSSTFGYPTSDAQCDPRVLTPQLTLRAWITHLNSVGTSTSVTETEFSAATLSDAERATLEYECYNAWRLGSGHGRCTCPPPPGP